MSKSNITVDEVVEALEKKYLVSPFLSDSGYPCVTLSDAGRVKTFILASSDWSYCLLRLARAQSWKISELSQKEITSELLSRAVDGEKRKVFVRVAFLNETIVIDANDDTFEAVYIDKNGYRIGQPKGVAFLRSSKQEPLPRPVKCDLKEFLNIFRKWFPAPNDGWILILAFILKALHRDNGSYAIQIIDGAQGVGKSTLSKRIKMLIDPSDPWSFSPPRNTDDVIVASVHSHLLVFDNVSGLSHEMADIFCRIATNGGVSKRKHYENCGEAFYRLHRPCLFNGIGEPSSRPDFIDRCVSISLEPITERDRKAETDLEMLFEKERPKLLGGLYALMSRCLKILPHIQKNNLPRMTDYARMGIAIEFVLGLDQGFFLRTYRENRDEQMENAFWSDDLCGAIFNHLMREHDRGLPGKLEGSASQIREKLFDSRSRRSSGTIPRSAKGFAEWLRRVEPLLLTKGIVIERPRRQGKVRNIVVRWADGQAPEKKKVKKPYSSLESS